MKIDPNITVDEFRSEMQHRVMRYSLRSLAVRQALRFACKHENPEFFRVATNKIHAQRQFQREMNGPGIFERAFDYFSLGSLREVVVTLLLVGLAVVGIDAGRKFLNRPEQSSTLEQMDVDELAKRLGILLEDSRGTMFPISRFQKTSRLEPNRPIAEDSNKSPTGVSDEDVQRIVSAVLLALQERDKSPAVTIQPDTTQQSSSEAPNDTPEEEVFPTVSLVSSGETEPPHSE